MRIEVEDAQIYCMAFHDVYLADVKNLFRLLNQEEKQKANAFAKSSDREHYIRAHGYLRLLLSEYFPAISPTSWTFVYNAYGKPCISPKHGVTLFFNLSHSKAYVAIIVHKTSACGIDIEEQTEMPIDEGICKLVFSKEEQKLYHQSKDKAHIFYQLWTLKEAYLKAVGIGLQQSPCEVNFACIQREKHSYNHYGYHCGTLFLTNKLYLSYAIKER